MAMAIQSYSRLASSTITSVLRTVAAAGALVGTKTAHAQVAAIANVNATTVVAPVSDIGLGLHTSVYAQFNNINLPSRLSDAGVQLMRYPGGSYADGYQWSTNSSNQGGSGVSGGYLGAR